MRKTAVVFLLIIFSLFSVFADSETTDETTELVFYEESDDFDDFDDFDALFEDAPDDIVVEEAEIPTITQTQDTEKASLLNITGSFTGKAGIVCVYDDTNTESKFMPGGLLEMSNTLSMSVKPADVFSLYGSLDTAFSKEFSLDVSSLYFNSLLFDAVYLSAGKKGISWGNLRIFPNEVLSDSGAGVSCEIRYPWKLGTITAVVLYDYSTYGVSSFTWKNMSFAGAADITVLNTNINAFVRKYPVAETPADKLLAGLELKRTLFGFDAYVQGNAVFASGFNKLTATGGFYRLWDGFTPNIGINIEYQYAYEPNAPQTSHIHSHVINAEFGIRRLGPSKNMKGAVKWNHNFIEASGNVDVVFIVSSIIPYADWTNGVKITYGGSYSVPKIEFGTALSFSLNY